jgi:acyl carrier protein
MGRNDDQVKIRGFRIEPGEIEAVLVQHPNVAQAVVTVREDKPGEKMLVAYLISDHQKTPKTNEQENNALLTSVRNFLKDKLPNYMMPSSFVSMADFPMTPNGKVDKKSLPKPDPVQFGTDDTYVAPQTEMEKTIAIIWAESLKIPQIGIYDDFFALGGHSLIAIQIVGRIHEALGVDIALGSIFEFTTVSTFAKNIEEIQASANNQKPINEDEDREILTI